MGFKRQATVVAQEQEGVLAAAAALPRGAGAPVDDTEVVDVVANPLLAFAVWRSYRDRGVQCGVGGGKAIRG